MKSSATTFFKRVFSVLGTMVKAKSAALKSKTNALKTRLIILSLLQDKRVLMTAISHKIHALMGEKEKEKEEKEEKDDEECGSDGEHSCIDKLLNCLSCLERDENTGETECLVEPEEDEEVDNGEGSAADFVRSFRKNDSEFNLEDEIDHVADVFIKRFHNQMRMQKQESFKRYQEMLERGL
ncbi:hypothetical protein IHE45_14G091300 [Dioscorea alata]|uniref:Uncharacterized protein n=1 Tax=Dioscorea alata TaxID=55571 RepID=A0ACB7UTB9_DIOAL|nr:hypothetical protein IHE45_14G091300 [Dioscorea alata]